MKKNILTRSKKLKAVALLQENRLNEAKTLCELILQTQRADIETLLLLGTTHSLLGNEIDAEISYRKALTLKPNQAELYHALATTLHRQNKLQDALENYRSALNLNPRLLDAHFQSGNILRDQGQLDLAAGYFREVLAHDPKYVPALCNLGGTLAALHQYEEATIHLNNAITLMPEATPVLCNMARILQETGKPGEAELRCREALRINPQSVDAISILAELLEKNLQSKEAHSLIQRGLSIVPGHFLLRYAAAKLARNEGRLQDAIDIAESILCDCPDAKSKAGLHYLIGQLYDRLNDVDNAFTHFTKANQISSTECIDSNTLPGDYLKKIEAYSALFRRARILTNKPGLADEIRTDPVFLVGFPRSGTTLLEQILDSHPQIQALDERPTVTVLIKTYEGIILQRPEATAEFNPEELKILREAYYHEASQHIALRQGQTLVDKLPLNLLQAYLIWRVFPQAKFILAIRHPCDAVLSCYMQNFALNQAMVSFTSLESTAAVYAGIMQLWQDYATKLKLEYHMVRYEDLVDNLEQEARQLIYFMGLTWDQAVLNHVEHARVRGRINTPSYHQVTQPIYRHASYRWKRYTHHMQSVITKLQPFITYFGYHDIV